MKTAIVLAILHLTGPRNRAEELAPVIEAEATSRGVDPLLVTALIFHESTFRADAVGASGKDFGLMQLRRGAATRYRPLTLRQLHDPATNIHLGVWYLSESIRRCGSVLRGLGAYSSGRCKVNPYARKVYGTYQRLKARAQS